MDYQADSGKTSVGFHPNSLTPGDMETKPPEKAEKGEDSSQSWGKVWYDYSQNTTLHGVNKITEETPFMLRRVFWLLIVCLGFALFLNQMIQSVTYFLDRPVTVNVKINYNKTLTFPAITICNQNDFRTTAAAERNVYAMIENYYSNLGRNHTDLGSYGNISLDMLYDQMAHKKDDMIVSCKWDEQDCDVGDFREILTDYGRCFSFNMVANNTRPRIVDRTGADRGLKMLINIEQYEYMLGPNPGAGIKILIHENTEVPSVQDLGHAIPPGTQAYVAIQITKVANLKPPHGQCNDSVQLQYFEDYSVPACVLECKTNYLAEECKCRDFYMKAEDIHGVPALPVCTLDEYQDCAVHAINDRFYKFVNEGEDRCECPISCHRLLYDPTISYAAISTYDTTRFKRSSKIRKIYERFLLARETFQRVDVPTVETDTRLMSSLNETILDVEQSISQIIQNVALVKKNMEDIIDELRIRTAFHLEWGLEKVKFVVHNDFIRGWDLIDERTLSLVTTNYNEMTAFIRRIMDLANQTLQDSSMAPLQSYYLSAEHFLYPKKVLCEKAKTNLTLVREGFVNMKPILVYKASPRGHYDHTWISPSVILINNYASSYLIRFLTRIERFCNEVDTMRSMMQSIYLEKTLNITAFEISRSALDKAAVDYNYYRFKIYDQVVLKTEEAADEIIKTFTEANNLMMVSFQKTQESLMEFESLLFDLKEAWFSIFLLNNKTGQYLRKEINKTELAAYILSNEIVEVKRLLKSYFQQIQISSVNINSELQVTKRDIQNIWKVMIGEEATKKYYAKVHEDVSFLKANLSDAGSLVSIFGYMVKQSKEWITQNRGKLDIYMNADFASMTSESIIEETSVVFSNFSQMLDIYTIMDGREDVFFKKMADLERSLDSFVQENALDTAFFACNFLSLDVFMKELSYEEIEQQVGYDIISFWSDIGGSVGLFIGASIISGFEIIDAILHHMFKKLMSSKKTSSYSA